MAEVDSKLATPDGQPLDGVGRNSRGEGEHHSTGLWMRAENRHLRYKKKDEKKDFAREERSGSSLLPPTVKFITSR